jgi:hypothetical protein
MQRSLPIYASTATRRSRRGWSRRRRGRPGLARPALVIVAALPVLGIAARGLF